jgi:predicted phage baseplate assembly protein
MSEPPILIGRPDTSFAADTCGCCAGTELRTVTGIDNRPGLAGVAYRVGDHGRFKASMLTNLGNSAFAPLGRLGTREDDDFTVALIDGFAAVCDVLTFYQERLANEAFLGTATEQASVLELARLIGYRPHPGAAAETALVLTMDDPPGTVPSVTELTVPAGTRVQSLPGPDETPQTFETLEDLTARVAWNALAARRGRRLTPAFGATSTWLQGVATGLQTGDVILFLGRQRADPGAPDFDTDSTRWDMRRITTVTPFPALGRTRIDWAGPIDSVTLSTEEPPHDHRIFHLRDRASLFGHNAPSPKVFSLEQLKNFFGSSTTTAPDDWIFDLDVTNRRIVLDAVHKGFLRDGWVALTWPSSTRVFRVTAVTDDGQSLYALSARATRLTLDTEFGLTSAESNYRRVSVYGNSTELAFADTPIEDWVVGSEVELDDLTDLPADRLLMVTGRRAAVALTLREIALSPERTIRRGAVLTLLAAPAARPDALFDWRLRDSDGAEFTVAAAGDAFVPDPATAGAETIAERVVLDRVEAADPGHSRLVLKSALGAAYDRKSFRIHGNVAPASHGESVTEILGAGNPGQPFQRFLLKQNPVTQRLAATETGVESTLSVRIDGVEWSELPDLYARDPHGRVFATRETDRSETVIQFGDGRSGARPPAGRDNIVAEYRRGLGDAGNVRAGQLSLLLDRPLGLKEATNPLPAAGGDDAESLADARSNAPVHTLTLGRVVTITDYRDFALGYPGIARADARWIWDGRARRIVVSVAGRGGTALDPTGPVLPKLLAALRDLGDPLALVDIVSYQPTRFRLGLKVAIAARHDPEIVLPALDTALRTSFAFESRDFARPVALSGIAAAAHSVPGVAAVDVDILRRESGPQSSLAAHPLLEARGARLEAGTFLPAEILTLAPSPLDKLEVMA